MAKVSIIMGIFNCEKTVALTIQSIQKQTFQDWELFMCDDGSTDQTFQIARKFSDRDGRIHLLRNKENMGLAKTLNTCLEHCTGEFIMRHDGDDLMVEKRIEKQVEYMLKHPCDACGSTAYLIDDKGVWGLRKAEPFPKKSIMAADSPFIHPTVIMKAESLRKVGGYSDNKMTRQRLEDYDLWLKFYENGYRMQNIMEPLIYFREDRYSYQRKSRKYRWAETKARFEACRRLDIPYYKRILAVKPLLVMMLPKRGLQKYHIWKSQRQNLIEEKFTSEMKN